MIAPKLRLLLNTKKDLQAILKVPNGVPFNQYVRYLAWVGEPIPKAHLFGDYVKGRFTAGGKAVLQDEVGEFTRLSKATNFVGGGLVEYEVGEARIEAGKGLLVEGQRTNLQRYGQTFLSKALDNATLTYDEYAPLGADVNFYKLTETATTGDHRVQIRGQTASATGPHCMSFIVKITESRYRFRLLQNTGGGLSWAPALNLRSGVIPDGWAVQQLGIDLFRVAYAFNVPSLGELISYLYLAKEDGGLSSYQGDGESHVFIAAPQLEEGSFPTSYIPTDGAPATRSPDLLRLTIPAGKTLTLDADDGISYVMENATTALITSDRPAYIRSARIA